MNRNLLKVFIAFCLAFLFWACHGDPAQPTNPPTISAELVKTGTCKSHFLSENSREACLEWSYAQETLSLRHINAGFNCCPGRIEADFQWEASTLHILEKESSNLCTCNCLYDLEFQISHLPVGTYQIKFKEPYRPTEDPILEATLDLPAFPKGRICVPRTHYPWGN